MATPTNVRQTARRAGAGVARGRTTEAGSGTTDAELTRQVARQTASDLAVEDFFERERDGAVSDVEAAKAGADQVR